MPAVTRTEIVDHVETAFGDGPVTRTVLLDTAAATQARPEVLHLLHTLPHDAAYRHVRELWQPLADLPVGS